eukprot:scaffold22443_cov112-Isochrysis_galbana.AAC.3
MEDGQNLVVELKNKFRVGSVCSRRFFFRRDLATSGRGRTEGERPELVRQTSGDVQTGTSNRALPVHRAAPHIAGGQRESRGGGGRATRRRGCRPGRRRSGCRRAGAHYPQLPGSRTHRAAHYVECRLHGSVARESGVRCVRPSEVGDAAVGNCRSAVSSIV